MQVTRTKQNREIIAVEGGADGKTQQDAWHNTCHLIWLAIRTIPKRHRLGWWQTTLRCSSRPLTSHPTQAETDYLTWSAHKHTPPTTRRMASQNRMGA